ncbi:MAG: hypothetical protein A2Y94_09310 [Caldithrix sp. RBG_13_44_9]|nr:MAG: hypothetical protein A2Y94_09310 [Caldithrix sp. RBG_13_44_9]
MKQQGFGGVEVAFIYPVNRDPDAQRIAWLSSEWSEKVTYCKEYCEQIGLGCDFTFGTLWPFGGTFVNDQDRTKIFGDPDFKQPLRLSWTHPDTGNVLNHLDRQAFERYARTMGTALKPALSTASTSALFCDSWEVETRRIWTDGFDTEFEQRFGYDLKPYMENIYSDGNEGPRYDYMKLVSDYVITNFYQPYTEACHQLGAISRVQCAGSPTDLISAYSRVDVPETEAMLYDPNFSKIVASAAALGEKPIISSETFTCLYGFPRVHFMEEQTADLKLVADALFANGVNQILWHGMPYNPAGIDTIYFYATVHVGRRGKLLKELPSFNHYLTRVSQIMQKGQAYSQIAVYLPLEDAWIAGEYPPELQMPWSWGEYELRYPQLPAEVKGYHPLWINQEFLQKGEVHNQLLHCGDQIFGALYLDVNYLDHLSLQAILQLARQGLPIYLAKLPQEPGMKKNSAYQKLLQELLALPNVSRNQLHEILYVPPMIKGEDIPDFWCRREQSDYYLFFSHPNSQNVKYPISYGQSFTEKSISRKIQINLNGFNREYELVFEPYQSILLKYDEKGQIIPVDIKFIPEVPRKE